MITIQKEGTTLRVSNDAYDIYFKDAGFKKVENIKPKEREQKEEVAPKKGEKELKVGDKK